MSLPELTRRLDIIIEETSTESRLRDQKKKKLGKADEFVELRKQLAGDIKNIKTMIENRNAQLQQHGNTDSVVSQSQAIRNSLRAAREDLEHLTAIHKKLSKKKKKDPESIQLSKKRVQQIELLEKFVNDYESWQKQRNRDLLSSSVAANELFASSPTTSEPKTSIQLSSFPTSHTGGTTGGIDLTPMAPPDLPQSLFEDDEDVTQEMELINKNEEIISEGLEQIHWRIRRLNVLATTIGDEVTVQNQMLDETIENVSKASEHMEQVNTRLKKVVTQFRSADRFVVDCIILIILIGIAGFVYKTLS